MKMKKLTVALAFFIAWDMYAQQVEKVIPSQILNEDRVIQIGLPSSYNPESPNRYPLILLTDGEWYFDMIYEASKLIYQNGGPKLIVVGITNTNRTKDLTFSNNKEDASSGGSDNFLRFIETELLTFLEANYKISAHRTLLGHSAGGLFTTYVMLSKPKAFDAYVAVTPTIRWDDFRILSRFTPEKLKELGQANLQFRLSIGNETGNERRGVLKLDSIFSSIDANEVTYSFLEYPHLSHTTVPWNAYFDALNAIFSNFYNNEAILTEPLNRIIAYYQQLGKEFDYDSKVPQRLLLTRGYELIQNKKFKEALENFQHYAKEYPDIPMPYSNMGDIYLLLGKTKEAKESFEQAYRLYPTEYVESKLKELEAIGNK
jgi:uncharacterized protein